VIVKVKRRDPCSGGFEEVGVRALPSIHRTSGQTRIVPDVRETESQVRRLGCRRETDKRCAHGGKQRDKAKRHQRFRCSHTLSKSGAGAPRTEAMTTWRDCSKGMLKAADRSPITGRASLCRNTPPGASMPAILLIASINSTSSKYGS